MAISKKDSHKHNSHLAARKWLHWLLQVLQVEWEVVVATVELSARKEQRTLSTKLHNEKM